VARYKAHANNIYWEKNGLDKNAEMQDIIDDSMCYDDPKTNRVCYETVCSKSDRHSTKAKATTQMKGSMHLSMTKIESFIRYYVVQRKTEDYACLTNL